MIRTAAPDTINDPAKKAIKPQVKIIIFIIFSPKKRKIIPTTPTTKAIRYNRGFLDNKIKGFNKVYAGSL